MKGNHFTRSTCIKHTTPRFSPSLVTPFYRQSWWQQLYTMFPTSPGEYDTTGRSHTDCWTQFWNRTKPGKAVQTKNESTTFHVLRISGPFYNFGIIKSIGNYTCHWIFVKNRGINLKGGGYLLTRMWEDVSFEFVGPVEFFGAADVRPKERKPEGEAQLKGI